MTAPRFRDAAGQSLVLVTAGLCALLVGAFALGLVAKAFGLRSDAQRAADLGALAGARAMLDAYPRLFEPVTIDGRPNPRHLAKAAYLALGRAAALRVVRRNGAHDATATFPDAGALAPVRIRIAVARRISAGEERAELAAAATAELSPRSQDVGPGAAGGDYQGPLAMRQGKPMRPDVAAAFDRMAAAASRAGLALIITSAYRSDAEQAVLFARHPDPKWVAPPGKSLHRYGTELDLGPSSAYGWLAANAERFHFTQRYSWEPWHYGFTLNPKSSPSRRDRSGAARAGGDGGGAMPGFVPARYERPIAQAAQRYNVSATLLAAQLYQESKFNPFAVSGAGAQGIAQFMPGTAAAYGLRNPFDAERAIDAQARLMRDLLRQFAAIPLALAAYNAGPARVAACGCVPAIAETQAYVAAILGLMGGAGDVSGGMLAVRLVA
jgi:hypothetical protein